MKTKINIFLSLAMFSFFGCNEVLDRPPLTTWDDTNFWKESNLRLYVNGFYDHFFVGYSNGWGTTAGAHFGFQFSDDLLYNGNQTAFELRVPDSRGNTDTDLQWINSYGGLNWNFVWVRKVNVMIDRINNQMSGILTEESKRYWLAVGRFFRALEYAGLVATFGDVPYYDREIGSAELDEIYKPRTPRNEVMDAIYDDFIYALENVGNTIGAKTEINRHSMAGFVSRWALFEGTWQKYHENNSARAQKFLNLAVNAAEIVMNSGRYSFGGDFRSLFGSPSLLGHSEAILIREYAGAVSHQMASQCNMVDGTNIGANLSLIKSFICNDGSDWQTSANDANRNFEMTNMFKTRDPRFEATFYHYPTYKSFGTFLYTCKFINRAGLKYLDEGFATPQNSEYLSSYNTNDYPVMRYAEVVLNWIEAKAELEMYGVGSVSQSDLDRSVNAIRSRPLDADAVSRGVQQTAPMRLANLPDSPDKDVDQLLWEIRRERRMEFAFEYSRLVDLRRWKRLEYMDARFNPNLLKGMWVKLSEVKNLPANWTELLADVAAVEDINGNITVFDGSNPNIEGFLARTNIVNRAPFLNQPNINPYLAPVGKNQRIDYRTRGYNLAQTTGWNPDLD